jgi:predicted transcriptional regulator
MLEYYTNIDEVNKIVENNSSGDRTTILKDQFTLEKSDFEKLKNAEQENQLKTLQYQENEKARTIKEDKRIYNMSPKVFLQNLSKVSIDIVEDITSFINQPNRNMNNFFIIFVKNERLIYVGTLLLILSLSLWFTDISK